MQFIDVERLTTTDDASVFLATILDDDGHEARFQIHIALSLKATLWLSGDSFDAAARRLGTAIGGSAGHSEELAGRRFRFGSEGTVGATLSEIAASGLGAFEEVVA